MYGEEVKSAQYYGTVFDSTPDVSHCDQMSHVIRHVKTDSRKVEAKELFLGFIPLKGKNAAEILQCLERDGLDALMCCSKVYDSAVNMAGVHGGVQAIIKAKDEKAMFDGCMDHPLNLCGSHFFTQS